MKTKIPNITLDLTTNTVLSKNDNGFIIRYHLHDHSLDGTSYVDNLAIYIENNDKIIEIDNVSTERFENELLLFGCNRDEIEKFINIKETGIVNAKNNLYKLHVGMSRQTAEDVLEDILAGRDRTLTNTQKKLLKDINSFKRKITHDEYINLSADEKELYRQCDNTFADEYDTVSFLQEFIEKHTTSVITINLTAELRVENPGEYVAVSFTNTSLGNKNKVSIKKVYEDVDIPRVTLNSVPLVEIHAALKCIFKKFEEHKFTSDLKPGILDRIRDNIITTYHFKQTKELESEILRLKNIAKRRIINDQPMGLSSDELEFIRKPFIIKSTNKIIPAGYTLMFNTTHTLKPEYESELKEVTTQMVNTTDVLYLINYLLNI